MKKIAIIEDNRDVLESTKEILEMAEYNVVTAGNGRDGLELVKSELPDLIFCDITMPDFDGFAVLNILKKHPETANIPFVFLSAKSEKSDRRKGMNLGADDYITKPFEESEILEAIEARISKSDHLSNGNSSNGLAEADMVSSGGLNELATLREGRKIKNYKKKDTIYRFDDFANYLYYINKGKVKSIISDAYSKDFIVDIHGEGDFLGYASLMDDGDYRETVKAMEDCEITVIPKQEFVDLYHRNSDVNTHFSKMIISDLHKREDRLLLLAYAPVRERLANALLILKSKDVSKNGSPVSFVISREDLACIVGTAKESLIRTLSELKSDGFIDTDGQEISILNENALVNLAP